MEYTTLGSTGMEVSRICLGGMSFGTQNDVHDWILNEEKSSEIIERAIDLGINFFDTANAYSMGESERILGNVLDDYDRDEQVVATKVFLPTNTFSDEDDPHPNASGLSRKTIEQELQHSLDRLGMESVDLYQIHRWDPQTPIEQTLRALDDAVRRGQVRYIGASSMWAHQFAEALHVSDSLGVEQFTTMQNHYNLLYREEEREMLPMCEQKNVGVTPWSPLARGRLTRPHEEMKSTTRGESDVYADQHGYLEYGGREINERVEELASEKGVKMAQISLAWVLHQDVVDAPIVGTTSVEHLEDAVEALDVDLSDSDLEYLEEPYEPMPVVGHE
ncbi:MULTISPECIES: aldo/keto reductase [unclassified Haloferax]|uniref:aldo/keto reductase n=1 Tax=unclassified Haloferax TaxID=2625095 RepID=UPI0002AFEA40|nr:MULTISPECIES: aldo/keto reductase [unclassified Haloferax]ELZ61335.1 aldo/keto reductase [Haloferax sp. ATCC BAA-645]ELZ62104.1 aldo/keto reductase [Haloferax sp. ATCC BAA-646]ELZ71344.1 aldo/keto reductase [Haloferax sp. ATCC BAA-644]